MGPGHLGPPQDDLAAGASLHDVHVGEDRILLLVGKVDVIGVVMDDDDRSLLVDDLGVDLADPIEPPGRPVTEDQMILRLKVDASFLCK